MWGTSQFNLFTLLHIRLLRAGDPFRIGYSQWSEGVEKLAGESSHISYMSSHLPTKLSIDDNEHQGSQAALSVLACSCCFVLTSKRFALLIAVNCFEQNNFPAACRNSTLWEGISLPSWTFPRRFRVILFLHDIVILILSECTHSYLVNVRGIEGDRGVRGNLSFGFSLRETSLNNFSSLGYSLTARTTTYGQETNTIVKSRV